MIRAAGRLAVSWAVASDAGPVPTSKQVSSGTRGRVYLVGNIPMRNSPGICTVVIPQEFFG